MTATNSPAPSPGRKARSLQQVLDDAPSLMSFLRAPKQWDRVSPTDYAPGLIIPQVPYEFSSWEREQRAWKDGVAIMDQSHHMNGVYLRGPDSLKFLTGLACNRLAESEPGRAHQILCTNHRGYLIGDAILFHLTKGELFMCGAPFAVNWVRYQAAHTDLDVEAEYEPRSPVYANGHGHNRESCRYQIQGPNAWALIEKLNGGPVDDVKFFHLVDVNIGEHKVRGLRHGMAGAAGLEIWAPWELRDELRETIIEEGREFGAVFVGSLAYLSAAVEGGWIPASLAAIFDEELRGYREWLPATEIEALVRIAGSHTSEHAEDFYFRPYDLGYEWLVDLEHEFVGRDAIKEIDPDECRHPISIVWDANETATLVHQMLDPLAPRFKPLHLPVIEGDHTISPWNAVTQGDQTVGFGHYTAYSSNERVIITLATGSRHLQVDDEVVLQWGEAGGGYNDRLVEADPIREIRGTVQLVPFSRHARTQYRG